MSFELCPFQKFRYKHIKHEDLIVKQIIMFQIQGSLQTYRAHTKVKHFQVSFPVNAQLIIS